MMPSSRSAPSSHARKTLHILASSIKELAKELPSAATADCKRFKQEQLLLYLQGNHVDVFSGEPLPEELVESNALNSFSHLGAMSKDLIECDFDAHQGRTFVSVQELHTMGDDWCGSCPSSASKKIDLANGFLNPYGCWRRSHSSGHLGFLLTSELRFAARGELLLRNSQTFVSQTFAAQTHGQDLGGVLTWDSGQLDPGTSMVQIIHVNVNQKSENDELIEIEGLLGQQLLRSKRVKKRTNNRRMDYTLRNQKIPSFVEEEIRKTHNRWQLDGPSVNSKGLLAVAIVQNNSPYAESPTFQNPIRTLCAEHNIQHINHTLQELNDHIKKHLLLNEHSVPEGSFSVVMVLDPLIDLGEVK
ncbi:hypothetical protein N9M68_06640 [Candidatus Poseidonia alphae]|nr:hypothetical protein [Candidatus Poseidonia alphae]MDA8749790.1 hypothetical protein [Candidatus Poseidonia alphae]